MLAIYTPTFNREKELHSLYKSLLSQSNKKFFWLVVDDGSSDNTEKIVRKWQSDKKIDIEYLKKENGGKHTALNLALDRVDNYWNICVDSDDWLLDSEVVERIHQDINNCDNESIVSIIYPYKFDHSTFEIKNREKVIVDDVNLRHKKSNQLEFSIVSKPQAYKDIRFPVYEGEKFMSEGAIETPKLFKGKRIYINEPIVEGRYLQDGLTENIVKLWRKNPKGYYYVRNLWAEFYKYKKSYHKAIKPLGQIVAFNLDGGYPWLKEIDNKILGILSIPFGIIYWLKKFKDV